MKAKKYLAIALCLALMCGLCMPAALAAGYADTNGHWAEAAIDRWSGYNIVEGYGGSFSPDDSLTRGQMAKILSAALGLTKTAGNPFTDVPSDAWYEPYVLRCYAAGIMLGDGSNARPDSDITRQETMVMFCRALGIAPVTGADLSSFADGAGVADWAAPYMAAAVRAGIITGVGDSRIAPTSDMTRAAFMTVLDRAVVQYINAPGAYTLTNRSGIILVASGNVTLTGTTSANILVTPAASGKSVSFDKATVYGTVTVNADNATVTTKDSNLPAITKNGTGITVDDRTGKGSASSGGSGSGGGGGTAAKDLDITTQDQKLEEGVTTYKNITITSGVGNGDVTLSNITIEENLYIRGGGSGSIHLENVKIGGRIIMEKESGDPPRLDLKNTPVSKPIQVNRPSIIEAQDEASKVPAIEAAADVEIKGAGTEVGKITVNGNKKVTVTVTDGAVTTVEARSETEITGAGGTVGAVTAEADVEIDRSNGVGTVTVPSGHAGEVTITLTEGGVKSVEVNSPARITGTGGNAETVEANDDVVVDSQVVDKVEVPKTASNVTVDVRGTDEITVEVDAEGTTVMTESGSKAEVTGEAKDTVKKHTHTWDDSKWAHEEGETHWNPCTAELDGGVCPAKNNEEAHKWTYTDTEGDTHTKACSVCKFDGGSEAHTWEAAGEAGGTEGWADDGNGKTHSRSCACGHKETEDHKWDEGEMTTPPTESKEGEKTFTCENCGGTKTESVPAASSGASANTSIYAAPGILRLDWDAKEGYTGSYYINGTKSNSAGAFYHLINTVRGAAAAGSYSFTISTSDDDGATLTEWARAEDILTVVFDEAIQPDVNIIGQEDGTYKFVPNDGFSGIYDYTMYAPDGTEIRSWYVAANGSVNVAPYEGCYFNVRELSWPTGNGLPSVTATISGTEKNISFEPYDFSETTATIETDDPAALLAALNKGGKVTLNCDVSWSTNTSVNSGGDVELDLNGHTITMGTNMLQFIYGKTVTITDSSTERTGAIIGSIGALTEASLTLQRLNVAPGMRFSLSDVRSGAITDCSFQERLSIYGSEALPEITVSRTTFTNTGVYVRNCKATFTDCDFKVDTTEGSFSFEVSYRGEVEFNDFTLSSVQTRSLRVSYGGTLIINSGDYTYTGAQELGLIYVYTDDGNPESKLILKGGTYSFNPSEVSGVTIDETCKVTDNGAGIYTVSAGNDP